MINSAPCAKWWFLRIKASDVRDLAKLLDAASYSASLSE
ncbi:hypothetical protein [Streptomyces hundungensis]